MEDTVFEEDNSGWDRQRGSILDRRDNPQVLRCYLVMLDIHLKCVSSYHIQLLLTQPWYCR